MLFPTISFRIPKITKQVDLAALSNNFSAQVANYLAIQTDYPNEYKISDLITKLKQPEFNQLDKEDGIITISQWNNNEDPMILYTITIQSLNIEISDYTFNLAMIKDA
ncbi:hypothetical protein II941_02140 [bacterium]|nr:hypothetical protein [bacterium]